ncbi:hypothetical protein DIS24_g7943 [Lasiodiplodia hormozganensis]|uniref:Zn(2)-C6 fungal-type domain-containing protein n=1 Tax=Lasiodiplodia hormozganensis TaxID=869390 RepID=A0AA39Y7L9_9PEZI|nr:hypothetical protein DIS24_g7943 [Lasiodiplodia hormozganensis]
MEANSGRETSFSPVQFDPAEMDHVLRRKRKAREFKACYPCRQRKVKCDQGVPCKTCIDREHPELCISKPSAKRMDLGHGHLQAPAQSGQAKVISASDWEGVVSTLKTIVTELSQLKSVIGQKQGHCCSHCQCQSRADDDEGEELGLVPSQGIHVATGCSGQTVYVGSNSFPAVATSISRDGEARAPLRELFANDVLPLFGLENESATYPFVDLWGLPHGSLSRVQELAAALPSDADCWTLLKSYKETSWVLFPVIEDVDELESELLQFLLARRASSGITERTIYGRKLHWVGLLFAVLASGSQCSGLSRGERELTSKVYVCCSVECLRITNFLSYSNHTTIQTLVILTNVLSNNVNAGVAWSLLGLTIRLAQAQGCDQDHAEPPARRLWWFVVWQDSLISLTFDRPAATTASMPLPGPPLDPYVESMSLLSRAALAILGERRRRRRPLDDARALSRLAQLRQDIEAATRQSSAAHLRDPSAARTRRQRLEAAAVHLHQAHIASELSRPVLLLTTSIHAVDADLLRSSCLAALAATVDAFLQLHDHTPFARRAWMAVYRALSCALLLGAVDDDRDGSNRELVARLIDVLADPAAELVDMSPAVGRAVEALRALFGLEHGPGKRGDLAAVGMRVGADGS